MEDKKLNQVPEETNQLGIQVPPSHKQKKRRRRKKPQPMSTDGKVKQRPGEKINTTGLSSDDESGDKDIENTITAQVLHKYLVLLVDYENV